MTANFLVLQSDFGRGDGAVAAMYGVAYTVGADLCINDLTHDIPPYDIFAASYRLVQTIAYWPRGTVFVSVVDPGVGSNRRSVVAKTKSGHYIVTPDNGTLSHVAKYIGLDFVKEINEHTNRLPHSDESHTFHGRDVYVYNGAKLAANEAYIEELPQLIPVADIEMLTITAPQLNNDVITGTIDILDIRFGSLWTNIPSAMLREAGIKVGDSICITIYHKGIRKYQNIMPLGHSFADVPVGEVVSYINSLMNLGVAINQHSFSHTYNIGTGNHWSIAVEKI